MNPLPSPNKAKSYMGYIKVYTRFY